MKKLIKFSVLTFVVAALFGMSGMVSADTRTQSTEADASVDMRGEAGFDDIFKIYSGSIDAKVMADIKASFETQKARCETIANRDQRALCLKQAETSIRTKLSAIMPNVKAVPVKNVSNIRGESVKADGVAADVTPRQGMEKTGPQNIQNTVLKQNTADNVKKRIERLEAFVTRFTDIAERLDSRIAKLVAQGVDTTESSKLLAQARVNLKAAKTATANARAAFESESNDVNKGATTDGTIIYSKEMFAKYCANVPNQATAPLRCLVDGTTYVNSDTKIDAPTPGTDGTFPKTRAYINEAGRNLIQTQTGLLLSTNSLKPGANKVGADAGATTVTEVGN